MRRMKWRGTVLFVGILTMMGLTMGLKLFTTGAQGTAATTSSVASAAGAPLAAIPGPQQAAATPSTAGQGAAASPTATKTIAGDTVQTAYGPIQVSVTFTGKKITGIQELQAPNDQGRSVDINSQAAPILAQEVLASQSAHIDTVSGATYTSDGYAQSVQSAIDKL